MSYEEAIKKFGSVRQICDAVHVSHQAVYQWKKMGTIPHPWGMLLELLAKKRGIRQ